MGNWVFFCSSVVFVCSLIFSLSHVCLASIQMVGLIEPPFKKSQMLSIDHDGMFLISNNSEFAFGFTHIDNPELFLLNIVHMSSKRPVWTANRDTFVRNSDLFRFDNNGDVYLQSGQQTIWSTSTAGKGATALELRDSGNLVLLGKDGGILWQSFSHPTDTLLSGQVFSNGMRLVSNPSSSNIRYHLQFENRDMRLYVDFPTPQPYWSMRNDNRIIPNRVINDVSSAFVDSNSWKFNDSQGLVGQFILTNNDANNDSTAIWAAVLGTGGVLSFFHLQSGGATPADSTNIPGDSCSSPMSCDPYSICSGDNRCQCPQALSSTSCSPSFAASCNNSSSSAKVQLLDVGDRLDYFALGFVPAFSKSDLNGCKDACLKNCSCGVLFFETSSGKCYLFEQIGSLQQSSPNSGGFVSYVKASQGSGGKGEQAHTKIVIAIVVVTIIIIAALIYLGYRYRHKNKMLLESSPQESEEDNFLETLTGMPLRFSYKDLEDATDNFTTKLGQGGFGSVYKGKLKDGADIAVKQLEGIGQGKKEFRAEVSIIGSIHHTHLVRLRGFCAEGSHRLLAYEFMANNSLDKWIFKKNAEGIKLDWATRYSIAVGTAKGLAYLHEDCDVKIVHCDIKPENVLLDEQFRAKVSDFGLAKLMNREQSHVFTTMRGTRGYLAPEWITSYAISEKSDVYSYGMVLLELIGGRKNFDPAENSEKAHFPTYALKMAEEKKLNEILDPNIKIDKEDDSVLTAIEVALWCIQEDMHIRPSMSRVVQMLEGVCSVPPPPTSSQMGGRLYANFYKSISEDGTASSGLSDFNSGANLSAMRLSGPR